MIKEPQLIKRKGFWSWLNPKYDLNPKWTEEREMELSEELKDLTQKMVRKFCAINQQSCSVNCVHFKPGNIALPTPLWIFGNEVFGVGCCNGPRCKLW
jgi:hypothetical protein